MAMKQLLGGSALAILFLLVLSPAAAQRDTTWRVQYNQKTALTHDDPQSLATPVEVRRLKFKDEFRIYFRLSDLMPKTQTLTLLDAKKQIVWQKSFEKITERRPPMFTGQMLIKTKKKLFGLYTLELTAPELIRPVRVAQLQIRAAEKKR